MRKDNPVLCHTRQMMRFVPFLVVASSAIAFGGETLSFGPWSVVAETADMKSLSFKGDIVVKLGGMRGYLPAWKGERFNMRGARVTRREESVAWERRSPKNQDATLTAAFTDTTCRYSLDTTIAAAGPTEFWVQLAPEAVRTDETRCFLWLNGQPRTVSLRERFDKILGIEELRFERRDRTIVVRCSRFELQDRRAGGSGLFLVKVIGSNGVAPRTTKDFIEIEVKEAAPEEYAGRDAMLSQRAVERKALTMKNPGFEADTAAGWSRNPFMSLDSKVKHSGAQAARMTINGTAGSRGSAYLIQTVPVQEGHMYQAQAWVRAQKVERASVGGMWPVGATVILEFADKQGKWFAGGSYGPKGFGSFAWRKVQTDAVPAPKGAGFAIVYLALRGHGAAWFDDVSLAEVRFPVILLSPLTGQRVHDNTPRLHWFYAPKTRTRIELCQNADFPAGEVVERRDIERPTIQIDKPLRPGRWYWRVSSASAVSDTWWFNQTAALDDDTTEPTIEEAHGYLSKAAAPIRVRYADNVGVTDVRMIVDGRDVSKSIEKGATEARFAPAQGWGEGVHIVRVRVADAAGNAAERKLFFTYAKPQPKTVWRPSGGVETDGTRRFLLGMYGVRVEDMPEIASAGFDFVHSYEWDGSGTNATAIDYLDAARKHGLQAFIGINRRRLIAGDEEFVAQRVGALMRHPALFAWYLFDEPDLTHQYVSPVWLERYYRLIKALDPFHPVVVTCARDDAVEKYRDALDVHWTQVYGSTAFVAKRLDKHRAALRTGTPLAAILHCYDRSQGARDRKKDPPDPAAFQPDGRLMRANAFMAIAHNSSCLVWWWWGYGGSRRYLTVANAPQAWASLKQTVADIKSLRPVLTAKGDIRTSVVKPADGAEVHVWQKTLPDRTVVIAVNRGKAECTATLAPKGLAKDGRVEVLFEDRKVAVQDGKLRDRFEPLEVHVYEMPSTSAR